MKANFYLFITLENYDAEAKKMLRRQKLNESSRIKNITLMVLSVSSLNIIISLLYSYALYLKFNNYSLVKYLKVCFFFMLSLHGFNFFIFFSFNKLFRKVIVNFFNRIILKNALSSSNCNTVQ